MMEVEERLPVRHSRELTFYRQNRRGKLLKISREKYLRTDLSCGSEGCMICTPSLRSPVKLDANPPIYSTKYTEKHYLIPDSDFIIRQLDVLEELSNVILLQLVMEDVLKANSNKYKRLRDGSKNRKASYFLNEHHMGTYIDRLPTESVEQRNRRAFMTAYRYLLKHFESRGIRLVILSDDPDFKAKHLVNESDNVVVATGEDYITHLREEFRDLDDKLCRIPFNEDESVGKYQKGDFCFPPHLPMKDLQDGIRSGKYLQGAFRSWSFFEGFVHVDMDKGAEKGREILIQGLPHLNRATNGDIVVIEVLKEEEWSVPSGMVVVEKDEPELTTETVMDTETEEAEEEIMAVVEEENKKAEEVGELKKATGKVVGIMRRKWLPCCGILRKSQIENSSFHYFIPDNRKLPRVRIETRSVKKFEGQKIVVQIDNWPASSRYPVGHYLKILGPVGEVEAETEAVLHEHGIPHGPFSKAVEACLPSLPYEIDPNDLVGRKDFRDVLVCSVDPPGCTDIDDALHCRALPDGTFEVGVHIADVSHYVKTNTALDEEAAKRGTSVYLADRRIDMIPPALSSNICSLHPNTEKLVFSVIWNMTSDAKILSTEFHKGVIRSQAGLTYAEAQGLLNSSQTDPITLSLKGLSGLAQILKRKRFEAGALMLSSAEVSDEGESDLECEESHSLVEEFMLLANCSVAEFTLENFREFALLRRHPTPPPSNFEPLLLAAKAHGITVVVDNGSKALNESIERQEDSIRGILRVLTTRCMTQAIYCCSGTTSSDDLHHFGLAAGLYTHFTSPIRRYADLMVHRLLATAIRVEPPDPRILISKRMHAICENINDRHRMAQYASRASYNLHKSLLLRGKKEEHPGYIMFIRRNALQIFLPKYGMEGFIFFPKNGNYIYNEKDAEVQFGSIKMHPLDQVTVEISLEADMDKVQFKLITPVVPGLNANAE